MKHWHLLGARVLLALAAPAAGAGERAAGGGPRVTLPSHGGHFSWERGSGFRRGHGFGGFLVVERPVPVIVEREVVREVPVVAAPPAPPPPRKPYAIGASYSSLPGGCMKMIEGSASYYYCGGGEWYRLVSAGKYKAVARP